MPTLPWFMILGAPALNIPLAVLFHGLTSILKGTYRKKSESLNQIAVHELLVCWVPVFGVALLAAHFRNPLIGVFLLVMIAGEIYSWTQKRAKHEAFMASREAALKRQAKGFIFDGACIAALLYAGVRYDSPLLLLGGVLRLHYNVWCIYHLLFLNVPAITYGFVAGTLLLSALFVYPLSPGTLDVESLRWLFSTIAQVFAAILGVVGLFATFMLQRVQGLKDKKLTSTTGVLEGVTGFTIVNLTLIGLSGASLMYAVGPNVPVNLTRIAVLSSWADGSVFPTILVVLTCAMVLNALGYTGVFLGLAYQLGMKEQSGSSGVPSVQADKEPGDG